jgi:histidinol phosphatase-like PHP family hydrolase
MKIDTHSHLLYSKEAAPDWKAINFHFNMAKVSGLDVVCVTEHLDALHYSELINSLFQQNCFAGEILEDGIIQLVNSVIISSAAEVSLKGGADVGLHVKPTVLQILNKNKGYYTLDTLVDEVASLTDDYIIVGHHLYRPGKWIEDIEEKAKFLDAIELPAKDIVQSKKYESLRISLDKPFVAGSDAHTWIQLGVGHTIIKEEEYKEKYIFNIKSLKRAINDNKLSVQILSESEKIIQMSGMYRQYLLV